MKSWFGTLASSHPPPHRRHYHRRPHCHYHYPVAVLVMTTARSLFASAFLLQRPAFRGRCYSPTTNNNNNIFAATSAATTAADATRVTMQRAVPNADFSTTAATEEPRFRTWPITSTTALAPQLVAMGLEVPVDHIDGTTAGEGAGGGALSDALVSVGTAGRGGTGSFISSAGLIITNWHVAYDAVRMASLETKHPRRDYVEDGYVARSRSDELAGPNYECWITEQCRDVSAQVLAAAAAAVETETEIARGEGFENEFVPSMDTDDDDDEDENEVEAARVQIKREQFDDEFREEEKEPYRAGGVTTLETSDPVLERANRLRNIRQELAQQAQTERLEDQASSTMAADNVRCDVVEMVPNKSYVLFTYRRLRDVRIVYVPPKSIGNFGGDTDNFEWPRHTGDFTLLRAYVPPPPDKDGISKGSYDGYHVENVPYDSSKSFIKIRDPALATNNMQEDDFVFLLGFPGSTMRYAPSSRLIYSNEVAVPHQVQDFTKKLKFIAQYEKDSNQAALKLGSTKKGFANNLKRSKGKLVMMNKLKLIPERQTEELRMIREYDQNNKDDLSSSSSVQSILHRLEEIYTAFRSTHEVSSTLDSLRGVLGGSVLLAIGHHVHEYLHEQQVKPDEDRATTYRKRNLPFLIKRLSKRLKDVYLPHEAALIEDCSILFHQLAAKSTSNELLKDDELFAKCCASVIDTTILGDRDIAKNSVMNDNDSLYSNLLSAVQSFNKNDGTTSEDDNDDDPIEMLLTSVFTDNNDNDSDDAKSATKKQSSLASETVWFNDPFVKVAAAVFDVYRRDRDTSKVLLSERDTLLAQLLEYQQKASIANDNYPDCNGSLRLSAGYVESYKAGDAIVHTPLTTLSGLYDKVIEAKLSKQGIDDNVDDTDDETKSEFDCPDRLFKILDDDKSSHDIPVCLLYSTDTVGGNSGSPVMNKRGELVGINFDRQRQGLMNEFKWSHAYSRSIGVDVRYILWLIGNYDHADHLIDEMISYD